MQPVMAEPPLDEVPRAIPDPPRRVRLPYVWILPILVVAVGLFVAVRQKIEQGTAIQITFRTADDLEPGKTTIRYKNVQIGEVAHISVSADRKSVLVEAHINRSARDYLVADTRFWVVRPRVSAGNVSGLGTLVSGSYIGVDVGHSSTPQRHFIGLEVPPVVTTGLTGREFVLHTEDIGSLNIGSVVLFRHIPVGEVVAYALDPGGRTVTMKVFINSPYDEYVTPKTRFWQASGIDAAVDSGGVHLHAESLASILEGGVAFQPFGETPAPESPADTSYKLFSDEEGAQREPNAAGQKFVMYFTGSLRGLGVGAPVALRGIDIGEVSRVSIDYDSQAGELRFPVEVDIYPQRIRGRHRRASPGGATPGSATPGSASPGGAAPAGDSETRALIDSMVAHGMRAELKSGNLLTGSKYVSVEQHAGAPREHVGWDADPPVFPTAPGAFDEIQDSLGDIAKKLDRVPYDQLSARLLATLSELQGLLKRTDGLMQRVNDQLAPQVQATLEQARGAMQNAREALAPGAPLQNDLGSSLLELSRAAKSVQALADYLERHPEALIRGKPRDPAP
jgi:paraquat-inducible protein B